MNKRPELKFSIELESRSIDVDLETELRIDVNNIDEELKDQPTLFAWYCAVYEHTSYILSRLKVQLQELEAEIIEELRNRAQVSGQVRLTEKMIDAQMKLDKRWQDLQDLIAEVQRNVNLSRVAKDAFQQRRDMLISLVSLVREERQLNASSKLLKVKEAVGFQE
jgi:hypothetical protein